MVDFYFTKEGLAIPPMRVISQTTEPVLDANGKMCVWIDTTSGHGNRTYLVYRRGSGDQILTELTTDGLTTQKVQVDKGGTLIGTRQTVNLIEGSNVTLTVADNAGSDRVDVTVAATSPAPANMATVPITDMVIYVRSDGSDSNDGTADDSGHALLTIQAALTKIPTVQERHMVHIHVGAGNFDGFYTGGLVAGDVTGVFASPSVVPLADVVITGVVGAPTLTTGVTSGTASAGGRNADGCAYLDKPTGADDWTVSELVGSHISVTGGSGPFVPCYIIANTATRITTSQLDAAYSFDATTQFSIREHKTHINAGNATVKANMGIDVGAYLGNSKAYVYLHQLDFHATASTFYYYSIIAFSSSPSCTLNTCKFSADSSGQNFAMASLNGNPELKILDCLCQKVGGGSYGAILGVYDPVKAVTINGFTIIDPDSGCDGILLGPSVVTSNLSLYFDGNSAVSVALRTASVIPFQLNNCVIKGAGTALVCSDDAVKLTFWNTVNIKNCTIGVYVACFGGASSGIGMVTVRSGTTTISDCGSDAFILGDCVLQVIRGATLAGTGNSGYGIRAKNNTEIFLDGATATCSLAGTSGDVLLGSIALAYSEVSSVGDYIVDIASDCAIRRVTTV